MKGRISFHKTLRRSEKNSMEYIKRMFRENLDIEMISRITEKIEEEIMKIKKII